MVNMTLKVSISSIEGCFLTRYERKIDFNQLSFPLSVEKAIEYPKNPKNLESGHNWYRLECWWPNLENENFGNLCHSFFSIPRFVKPMFEKQWV